MAEQFLHDAQVGAAVQQMRRVGVPQGMGMGRRVCVMIQDPLYVARPEAVAAQVHQQGHRVAVGPLAQTPRIELVAATVAPGGEQCHRRLAEGHSAGLGTLADHLDVGAAGPDGATVEPAELGDPQAAAVEQFEHQAVPHLGRIRRNCTVAEHLGNFRCTEHARQPS